MKKLTSSFIKSILKTRNKNAHKGNFGHALLIAGNNHKIGAALISSKACLRSGVGLLTTVIPQDEKLALQIAVPEAMVLFRENEIKDVALFSALGIGPGIGTEKVETKLLKKILLKSNIPLVLDADALTILAHNPSFLKLIPQGAIFTPHPKEFDRLFGEQLNEKARREKAQQMATKLSIIIVLKGHETFICSSQSSYINTTGNVGLAKGGSGDALTGMILAFLSQGYDPLAAASIAVFLHGLAADLSIQKQSVESLLITDVIEQIGQAFQFVRKQ